MPELYNIAVVTGGPGDEREISLLSAQLVMKSLPENKYRTYLIDIQKDNWVHPETGNRIDLNDFSLPMSDEIVRFDAIYLILHGSPAEDGKLQAYFDMLGITYTGCSSFVSALTFDKYATKQILSLEQIPMAKSRRLYKSDECDVEIFKNWDYPLFVKPNKNGSSYGVSRVGIYSELEEAIAFAFEYDNEILVEAFLSGRECSCGVYRNESGEVEALPITEIIPEGEFFNYEAKYKNKSKEITPARFTDILTEKCQQLTERIYQYLNCSGFVRVDYILIEGEFYFLELNTIPGLSPTSMIPQQVIEANKDLSQFLEYQLKIVLE